VPKREARNLFRVWRVVRGREWALRAIVDCRRDAYTTLWARRDYVPSRVAEEGDVEAFAIAVAVGFAGLDEERAALFERLLIDAFGHEEDFVRWGRWGAGRGAIRFREVASWARRI